MTISPEEMQKYVAFIEEQVKFVKVLEINTQEIIWHYTTGDALLNIVESGALYATQVSCLNDSTEVLYGEKLLRDAFINIQTQNTKSMEEAFLLERIMKNISSEPTMPPTNIPSPFFVTCFSKEKDDLSQWRAYSGGENGYAIAFLAGAFFNRGSLVVRVNYEKEQHKEVAKKVAKATLQFFKEGVDTRPASGTDNTALMEAWANEFLATWQALISRLAPMVKDPAFRGENEYRIVHELQPHEFSRLRLRQKQTLMSRHLPLVFPPLNYATQSDMLPIMEVMVGPGRHKEISRVSVDTLLRQKGYTTVPVSMSSIPFQMT